MFRLDVVLIWGHLFRHNAHKQPLFLLLHASYIYMLLMLYFLVFTAVLMGWVNLGLNNHFGCCICLIFTKL